MAAGDIKDERAVVIELTAGAAVVKGQVVHLETDHKYDPCAASDKGKFAVATVAASGDTETFRAVIWGPVEVTATAAAISKGAIVMADTAGTVTETDWAGGTVCAEHVGTAMEAFASAGVQTIWVGLVQ
jgi:hypothetical protein